MAGVGLTWYTWLEQARDIRASTDVLESLARALRLDPAERGHLFFLAGQPLPAPLPPRDEAVPAALQRMLDGLATSAAYVVGRRWDILAWNEAAATVFGDYGAMTPEDRNGIWLTFTSPHYRRLFADWEGYARTALAQFRVDCARFADDPYMAELVGRLTRTSREFSTWWPQHDVGGCGVFLKTLDHPVLGRLVLEHTSFHVTSHPDLRLVVHTRVA